MKKKAYLLCLTALLAISLFVCARVTDEKLPASKIEVEIPVPEPANTDSEQRSRYIINEESAIAKLRTLEQWRIPADFDYDAIAGLRNESRMKLKKILPTSLSQAGRIDGVTPAEIALLQVHLSRYQRKNNLEKANTQAVADTDNRKLED